jgi:hypothetical protein
MLKKDYQAQKSEIKAAFFEGQNKNAVQLTFELIHQLFEDKNYKWIVDLFMEEFIQPKESLFIFEVAYSISQSSEVRFRI